MPHIHEKIDFTVAIFVVHDRKILVIHHRKLDKWLPLGGHIELEEDPEQAVASRAKRSRRADSKSNCWANVRRQLRPARAR